MNADSIVANYEHGGIDTLRREVEGLDNAILPELLSAVMKNDDKESFLFLYHLNFPFSFFLKHLLRCSRRLSSMEFLKLIIARTAFGLAIFKIVEEEDEFDVDDVCLVLLTHAELGLLPYIGTRKSLEPKVAEAMRRITCDV